MGRYDDIITLEHPEPRSRKRMPSSQRAAQFMPFAALDGEYLVSSGKVKKFDRSSKTIIMEDGTWISVADIMRIDGSIFSSIGRK